MMRRPPCHLDPESWDQDPGRGPHRPVDELVQACLTQCPVLARCVAMDTAGCYGVIAGEYRPWPSDSHLKVAERATVRGRVIAGIRDEFEHAASGTALPKVDELARVYGVSTTTVRGALRWLAHNDVLVKPATRRQTYRVAQRTESAA